jgi:signal transduction histidine kinase
MDTPLPPLGEDRPPDAGIAELSALIDHLQSATEGERVRLSRALHDELGGLLVSAVMDLGWIEQHSGSVDLGARLSRVRAALAAAIDLKRSLIEDLRPSLLDNFGLFAAYRWHVKRSCELAGVLCIAHYPQDELPLQPAALAGLFRTLQETLEVILAQPSLSRIDLTVAVTDDALVLQTNQLHDGQELTSVFVRLPRQMLAITGRIDSLGGVFTASRHAAGSTFIARFPMQKILLAT